MICVKCGCVQFQLLDWHDYLKCFECAALVDLLPGIVAFYEERPIEPKQKAVPRSFTEVWINEHIEEVRELRATGTGWETINMHIVKVSGIKTKQHVVKKYAERAGIK